ncbi:MAG: HD domain-containing protein [Oscillospiraceae bacterium]|nr:HD domain-containing protein [Oscillospiraceae bacterium]
MLSMESVRHYEPFSSPDLDDLLNHFSSRLRNHSRRVAVSSAIIAEYAAYLHPRDIVDETNFVINTHLGAACHDIGKLLFPALLTDEEDYLLHPSVGAQWLDERKPFLFDNEKQAQTVIEIVRHHHEHANGGGFPDGLKARDIPLSAAIVAVANGLDHYFCSRDLFRNGTEDVLHEFMKREGNLYTSSAVLCLERAWDRLRAQYIKWLPLQDP